MRHYFVYGVDDELIPEGTAFDSLDEAIECAKANNSSYISECTYESTSDNGERQYHKTTLVWQKQ